MSPLPHMPGRRSLPARRPGVIREPGDPVNALHQRLGRIPYRYVLHSALNDYQVTLDGPAGRAIITEIDGGEDYQLETMFYGEATRTHSVREWYGYATPQLAVERLMFKTNVYLGARGVQPPPLEAPRSKAYVLVAALVLAVVAVIVALALFSAPGDDEAPVPSPSFTVAPGEA